ncbi:hypothetical protein [Rhizobium sp. 2MFCol3.1]|uniref:hypothetical protein n=1 Tax=Rhizobium sp. 2MFCol3.1 TaxID=1246459 RepID=UPI00036F9539|nr:hypothetical protein [Rhizobium sp. 2MFCol3.1]
MSESTNTLREVLSSVRNSVKNARGAIESNQVVDKDVHGTLTRVITTIDAALTSPPPHHISVGGYERQEAVCTDAAMSQWGRSKSRPDLDEEARVRGAIEAYKRQAFAFAHLLPAPAEHVVGMDEEDRTPAPEGYDAAQWRKADEVHHATALVANDPECVKIIYAALASAVRDGVGEALQIAGDQARLMADLAIEGLPENARQREAMEAALTRFSTSLAHTLAALSASEVDG